MSEFCGIKVIHFRTKKWGIYVEIGDGSVSGFSHGIWINNQAIAKTALMVAQLSVA